MSFFVTLLKWLGGSRRSAQPVDDSPYPLGEKATQFLLNTVSFYKNLSVDDRRKFDERVLLFIESTDIIGQGIIVTDEDCLLIAASAIIPVWAFPKWHYFNLSQVILLPNKFNHQLELEQPDSTVLGMVGSGQLSGKMYLSQPHLHHGFKNSKDRKNVGIHEFAHIIDMADGNCDGSPNRLPGFTHTDVWLDFVHQKTNEILKGDSDIDEYAATQKEEFFPVASEYFFERPKLLRTRHPKLYDALERFYRQNLAEIEVYIEIRRNAPCPCGSGKKYKHCCSKTLAA